MSSRFLFALLFSVAFAPLASGLEPQTADKFDVIIKGGTVYDGTGEKPRVIDVDHGGDRIRRHLRVVAPEPLDQLLNCRPFT